MNKTKEIKEQKELQQSFQGVGIELTNFENHGMIVMNTQPMQYVMTPQETSVNQILQNIQNNFNNQITQNSQINQHVKMEMERALMQLYQSQN